MYRLRQFIINNRSLLLEYLYLFNLIIIVSSYNLNLEYFKIILKIHKKVLKYQKEKR
jgi:hypothetical protein